MNDDASQQQLQVNKSRDEQWMCNFRRAEAFFKKNGHLTIPDKTLMQWITYQRRHAKTLNDRQMKLLDSIRYKDESASGIRGPDEQAWEEKYNELKSFAVKQGNTKGLPGSLRSWVTRQKRDLKKKSLHPNKQRRLEAIGVDLSNYKERSYSDAKKERDDAEWNQNFSKLERYREKHGHCNVPYRYPEDSSLGGWVSNQRTRYKRVIEEGQTIDSLWWIE
jgi:hypothetical protein